MSDFDFGGRPVYQAWGVSLGQTLETTDAVFLHPYDFLEVTHGNDIYARLDGALSVITAIIDTQAEEAISRIDKMYR